MGMCMLGVGAVYVQCHQYQSKFSMVWHGTYPRPQHKTLLPKGVGQLPSIRDVRRAWACAGWARFAELRETKPWQSKYPYHGRRRLVNIAGHAAEYKAAPACLDQSMHTEIACTLRSELVLHDL